MILIAYLSWLIVGTARLRLFLYCQSEGKSIGVLKRLSNFEAIGATTDGSCRRLDSFCQTVEYARRPFGGYLQCFLLLLLCLPFALFTSMPNMSLSLHQPPQSDGAFRAVWPSLLQGEVAGVVRPFHRSLPFVLLERFDIR